MTNRKFLTLVAGAAVALSAAGCKTDELVKVNNNPNNPTVAPAPALFTNAVRLAVSRWLGSGYDQRSLTLTAQHFAEVQYPDTDAYRRLAANFTTAFFDNAYAQEQEDFQQIINANVEAKEPGLYGPALVMRTWGYGYLTDSWGDVPYFSALTGDKEGGSLSPAYDDQKAIYADFFKVLAQATTDMAAATSTNIRFGAADPIYAGNLTRWTRFSNSLRARQAMRLVNVDPTTAKNEFVAAFNAPNGLIASNADNAQFSWPGDGVYDNPWAVNFRTRDDHRMSNVIMNILVPTADPRLPVYAQPTRANPAVYAGMPNALTHNAAQAYFNTASRPGTVFYSGATAYGTFGGSGQSFPSFLLTYAEVSLLKAEAAERGWIAGSAKTYYEDGIRASMAQWGVTNTAAIDAYIASPAIAYAGGTAGLTQIATQKWLALYTDGGQAWMEWRRTCVPNTIKPGPDATIATVPRRLQYSITENAVNAENVSGATSRQGADLFTSRMYWDKNPTAAPTYTAGCGQR
jgi:hypothetical protein